MYRGRTSWDEGKDLIGVHSGENRLSTTILRIGFSSYARRHAGCMQNRDVIRWAALRNRTLLPIISSAAMSTCLPSRSNEAEFIEDMIAPRGDHEYLNPRGLHARSSAGNPPQ